MNDLDILGALIGAAQGAMPTIAAAGLRLGATIAGTLLLFGLAIRIAGGGAGSMSHMLGWIVFAGLVLAALAHWPEIMEASFATANEVAQLIGGGGIGALDVIQRGNDLFMRVVDHGVSGAIWNPVNWLLYMSMVGAAFVLLLAHLFLSLVVAGWILIFWIGGAVLPIVIPLGLIPALSGIGFSVFSWVVSSVVAMIVLSVIITISGDVLMGIVIPGPGETLTLADLMASQIAILVIVYLAWRASSFAASIARAAPGGTGITGLTTMAATAGLAGAAGGAAAGRAGAGAVAAGAARGGSAAAGGGGAAGGAAGGGARAGSGSGQQSAAIGRQSNP